MDDKLKELLQGAKQDGASDDDLKKIIDRYIVDNPKKKKVSSEDLQLDSAGIYKKFFDVTPEAQPTEPIPAETDSLSGATIDAVDAEQITDGVSGPTSEEVQEAFPYTPDIDFSKTDAILSPAVRESGDIYDNYRRSQKITEIQETKITDRLTEDADDDDSTISKSQLERDAIRKNRIDFISALPEEQKQELESIKSVERNTLDTKNINLMAENILIQNSFERLFGEISQFKERETEIIKEGGQVSEDFVDQWNTKSAEYNDLVGEYAKNTEIINNNTEDIGDLESEIDLMQRNYGWLDNAIDQVRIASEEMTLGLEEFVLKGLQLSDLNYYGTFDDFVQNRELERDFRKFTLERQKKGLAPHIDFNKLSFNDPGEIGMWAGQELLTQVPVISALIMTGGTAGLATVGAGAGGQTMSGLREEVARGDLELTDAEIFTSGAIDATFEVAGEVATMGILKRGGRVIRAALDGKSKGGFLKGFYEYIENVFKETLGESGTTIGQNMNRKYFVGDDSVHIFDNIAETIASAGVVSSAMHVAPRIIGEGIRTFRVTKEDKAVKKNNIELKMLTSSLKGMAKDDPAIEPINNRIESIIQENKNIIENDIKTIESKTPDEIRDIIAIDKKIKPLQKQLEDVYNSDMNINAQDAVISDLNKKIDKLNEQKDILIEKETVTGKVTREIQENINRVDEFTEKEKKDYPATVEVAERTKGMSTEERVKDKVVTLERNIEYDKGLLKEEKNKTEIDEEYIKYKENVIKINEDNLKRHKEALAEITKKDRPVKKDVSFEVGDGRQATLKTRPKTPEEDPQAISDPLLKRAASAIIDKIINTTKTLEEFSERFSTRFTMASNHRQDLNEFVEARQAGLTDLTYDEWRGEGTTTRDATWDTQTKEALPESKFENKEQLEKELKEGTWGMLTGETKQNDAKNTTQNNAARKWLEDKNYEVEDIFGKYKGSSSKSFYVKDLTREDAIAFTKEFNQEPVATNEGLVYQDGTMNPRVGEAVDVKQDDFYSTIKTKDGNVDFAVEYNFDEKVEATKEVKVEAKKPAKPKSTGDVLTLKELEQQKVKLEKAKAEKLNWTERKATLLKQVNKAIAQQKSKISKDAKKVPKQKGPVSKPVKDKTKKAPERAKDKEQVREEPKKTDKGDTTAKEKPPVSKLKGKIKDLEKSEKKTREVIGRQAKKAIASLKKLFPEINIVTRNTTAEYIKAVGKENADSKGIYFPESNTIYVNLETADKDTVGHEVFHTILLETARKSGAPNIDKTANRITTNLLNSLEKSLSKDSKEYKLIQELKDFTAREYNKDVMNEEVLANIVGFLTTNYTSLNPSNKSKVRVWINKLAKLFGLGIIFKQSVKDQEIVDFLNTLSDKIKRGVPINENDVQAIIEGSSAPVSDPSKLDARKQIVTINIPKNIPKKIKELKDIRKNLLDKEYIKDNRGEKSYSKKFFIEDDAIRLEITRLEELNKNRVIANDQADLVAEELNELNKPFLREVGSEYYPRKGTFEKSKKISDNENLGGIYEVTGEGYLFRGVSIEDFNRIKEQGFVDSDTRGAISKEEGINLATNSVTAFNYLPQEGEGVVMAIKVSDKNGLFMIGADDYVRSSSNIPISDVEFVTTKIGSSTRGKYTRLEGNKTTTIEIVGRDTKDKNKLIEKNKLSVRKQKGQVVAPYGSGIREVEARKQKMSNTPASVQRKAIEAFTKELEKSESNKKALAAAIGAVEGYHVTKQQMVDFIKEIAPELFKKYDIHYIMQKEFSPEEKSAWNSAINNATQVINDGGSIGKAINIGTETLRNTPWWQEQQQEEKDYSLQQFKDRVRKAFETELNAEDKDLKDRMARVGDKMRNMSLFNRFRIKVQDRMFPLKKVIRLLDKEGIKIPDELNPYILETLQGGRAKQAIEDMMNNIVDQNNPNSLFSRMKKAGINQKQLGDFMLADHAIERNQAKHKELVEMLDVLENKDEDPDIDVKAYKKSLQKSLGITKVEEEIKYRINGLEKGTYAGYGMSTNEALKIVNKVEDSGKEDLYNGFSEEFREDVINESLKAKYETGMISDETYEVLSNTYQKYVPLMVEEIGEVGGDTRGVGNAITGLHRIKGDVRERVRKNPMLAGIEQFTSSVMNSELNRTGLGLLDLVEQMKGNDFMEVIDEQEYALKSDKKKEHVIKVIRDGKDYYINIYDKDLAISLKKSITENDEVFKVLNIYNTWMRNVLTQLNPAFMIPNYARDFQQAYFNLPKEVKKKISIAEFTKMSLQSFADIRDYRGKRKTGRGPVTRGGKMYEELLQMGGVSKWGVRTDPQKIADEIADMIKSEQDPDMKSLFKGMVKNVDKQTLDRVRRVGDYMEHANRLAIYKASRKSGLSKERSAFEAKEGTINFDRNGDFGKKLNTLFLFSNASIQGTTRMLHTIKENPVVAAKLMGKIAGSAAVMMGAIYALGMGDDYEEESEWNKLHNIYFPIYITVGDHKELMRIPAPYGLGYIPYIGQKSVEMLMTDKPVDMADLIKAFGASAGDVLNPLGSGIAVPTITKAPIELLVNYNYMGNNIYAEDTRGKNLVQSESGFRKTGEGYKQFAKMLNKLSSGNENESGLLDFAPEGYKHMLESLGGGVWNFAKNTKEFIAKDEDYKIPVLRRFMGTPSERVATNKFKEYYKRSGNEIFTDDELKDVDRVMQESIKEGYMTPDQLKNLFSDIIITQVIKTAARAKAQTVDEFTGKQAEKDLIYNTMKEFREKK